MDAVKATYRTQGLAKLPDAEHFTEADLASVVADMRAKVASDDPGLVYEGDKQVRAVHGYAYDHLHARMDRLRQLACDLLGCRDAYVHQYRVNIKQARTGGAWKPHRDFDFWQREDGMPDPEGAVLFHVCITAHHADNGPILAAPGSHRRATRIVTVASATEETKTKEWTQCFSEADLKYQLDLDSQQAGATAAEIQTPILGAPGDVYIMHPLMWHQSSENTSDDERILLSVIFNSVDNVPTKLASRPSYIAQAPPSA